jgi:sugar lactone lactonase YvrE
VRRRAARRRPRRPVAGTVEDYSGPFERPGQLAFDDAGALYVTDSGRIVRIAPGGAAEIWTDALRAFPSGCCLNGAGDALYVVQTEAPGLHAVPIRADGSAGEPELLAALPGTVPHGVAAAADGSFYVACYRPDAICRIGADGEVDLVAHDPLGWIFSGPTDLAFGGPGLSGIVVANLNQRYLSLGELDVRGLPLRYPTID